MLGAWGHQNSTGKQNPAVYMVWNTVSALHSEVASVPLPSQHVWFSSKSQKCPSWKKEVPALKSA